MPTLREYFPNAAQPPAHRDGEKLKRMDAALEAELAAAGIDASVLPFRQQGEVPTTIIGQLHRWRFTRNWNYWVCRGPGLPYDAACHLHDEFGSVVRCHGDATGPHPYKAASGLGIDLYHVDTAEGLKALSTAIASVVAGTRPPEGVE